MVTSLARPDEDSPALSSVFVIWAVDGVGWCYLVVRVAVLLICDDTVK